MDGYIFSSGMLFLNATEGLGRLRASGVELLAPGRPDARVSAVFAAATLEAFVMELGYQADLIGRGEKNEKMLSIAAILNAAEESRGSTRLKFELAKVHLTGKPFDRGSRPFQDFDLLLSIRDALIHLKPHKLDDEPNKLLKALRSKGLVGKEEGTLSRSFAGEISTAAVAEWACVTVCDMVDRLRHETPDLPELRQLRNSALDDSYRRILARVAPAEPS